MPKIEIKTVCNIYDLSFITYPQFFPNDLSQYWRINVAENAHAAGRVIVNTQVVKEEAAALLKLPEEKIDIIPLAPSGFYRLNTQGELDPKEARRFTMKDYILYVGTVEPRKNLKVLIRAYKDIKRKYDLALVIAGGPGWYHKDIVSYPKELGIEGDVIYTKYVDETSLLYLYRHASVFVYPSLYEGFGLPPLEAMACGIPVLISDIPSLREVTGDAALTFNPKDHEELAHLLDRVLSSESLRMDMKNNGLRRSSEYSWEKVVRATIQTYQKTLKD
jgi:glycosyltransferase involved in cell wall biosynthesis